MPTFDAFEASLNTDISRTLTLFALIFTRFLTSLSLTPYLAGKPVPAMVRTSLAMALALFVFFNHPDLINLDDLPKSIFPLILLFIKEAMYGFLMGIANTMVFYGIQSAGSMIDNQRSLANARIFNPALASQTSVFGAYFYQLAIAIFIAIGGHHHFLKVLVSSFDKIPLLAFPTFKLYGASGANLAPLVDLVMSISGNVLLICLQLAAPITIALFIADLILGLTNRIAPMVNVFEMGFNVKAMIGNLLAWVSVPAMIYATQSIFENLYKTFDHVTNFFLR